MGVELFDLVDERDTVIGVTHKKQAHITGDLHRIAAVFVFNHKGELYIQEHQRDGKWDNSVGGHVRKDETYAQTAVREAYEELCISQPLEEIAVSLSGEEYSNERHFFGLYACTVDKEWQFVPNDEVKKVFPMSIKKILHAMEHEPETRFTRGFRITMDAYLHAKGLR